MILFDKEKYWNLIGTYNIINSKNLVAKELNIWL